MEKNETSRPGSYLVPTSGQAIARRSDALVRRGLRELYAVEQEARFSHDVFQRLDDLRLDYCCGTAWDEWEGLWKCGDPFSYFTGSSLPGSEGEPNFFEFEFLLIGNDDLDFWMNIGDPAQVTQERLRSTLLKYRSKLRRVGAGMFPEFLGELQVITPPFESRW